MNLRLGTRVDAVASTPGSVYTSLCGADPGEAMHRFIAEMYPICRSITGEGVRATLELLRAHVPITVHEVPSGLQLFDWTIPPEWTIRDAYIKNRAGERVVDFTRSNLHVVSYSRPVAARMSLEELRPHLFTLPEQPDWIPYRTSYGTEDWGFCLTHNQLLALDEDVYEICIDSSLRPGYLTYGEFLLRGRSLGEVLISCHICHPSLCNDNLSGIVVAAALAQRLLSLKTRYSYRFLFIPSTIGSVTWLALNHSRVFRIKHGLVLMCLGDFGKPHYKASRRGDAEIDRVVAYVLKESGHEHTIEPFSPFGYDERQFCSPGFDLPLGCFSRSPWARFPQYHTSADDLTFVAPAYLHDSLAKLLAVVDVLENNRVYINRNPYCEPRLRKYDLYHSLGDVADANFRLALPWVLNMSDGSKSLLDIATEANLPWEAATQAARGLCARGLLTSVEKSRRMLPAKKRRADRN